MLRSVFSSLSRSVKCTYPVCRFATAKDYEREIARRSMAELNSEKEAHEILFGRIANILKNIADGQTIKVLQLYPESKNIIGALGKVRFGFELLLSNTLLLLDRFETLNSPEYLLTRKKNKLSMKVKVNSPILSIWTLKQLLKCPSSKYLYKLSLLLNDVLVSSNTFQVVLNLLPFTSKAPQASNPYIGLVNPEELLRIINIPGYVIFGAPVSVWEHWDMTNQLQFLDNGELIVVQWLKFNPSRINEHGGIIDNDRDIVILRDETEDTPSEEYTVAVVQKVDRHMDAFQNMVTKHQGDPREHPAKPIV